MTNDNQNNTQPAGEMPDDPDDDAIAMMLLTDDVDTLKRRVIETQQENARLAGELECARTYTGVEGYPCPLCTYEHGVFVAPCEMHQQIDALRAELAEVRAERDEWVQNVNELDSSLAQATYAVDDVREQLAALRAEARWEPVVYSTFVEDQSYNDTYLLITLGGTQLEMGTDPTADGKTVNLPSDMRLCRLVPGQDTAQGRIAELEAQLAEAKRWTPTVNVETGQLTVGDPVVDEWLTPDEDAAWAHLQDTPAQESGN